MARPKGSVADAASIDYVRDVPRRRFIQAAHVVALELEGYIKERCSRVNPYPYKNPSAGGEYPKMRTGNFADGVRVVVADQGRYGAELRIYSAMPYGKFLESGTTNMEARPWASRALEAKDWIARVTKLARALVKEP